jgi:hypothetical protein
MPAGCRKTSAKAVAGMVLGITSIVPCAFCGGGILAVLGLVFSSLAIREISRKPVEFEGRGFAIAGLATSAAGLLIGLISLLMFGAVATMFTEFLKQVQSSTQGLRTP